MLALGRRVGEKIQIGKDISIMVIGMDSGVVRLGIDAPREMAIEREEIIGEVDYNALEKAREQARQYFDLMWQTDSVYMTRSTAMDWLSRKLKLRFNYDKLNYLNLARCKQVIWMCDQKLKGEIQ